MFEMVLEKNETTELVDYNYLPVWVYKPKKEKEGHHFILVPSHKDRSYYSDLQMPITEYEKMKLFHEDTWKHLEGLKFISTLK